MIVEITIYERECLILLRNTTLVTMSSQVFQSLDDEALVWTCMKPTHEQVAGKSQEIKSQVFAQLTAGQQALFLCLVLHGHVGDSPETYYCWLTLLLPDTTTWSAVKRSFQYFDGEDEKAITHLLEEIEGLLATKHRQPDATWRPANPRDLEEDAELGAVIDRLYAKYRAIMPATLTRIAEHIRNNLTDFVQIKD